MLILLELTQMQLAEYLVPGELLKHGLKTSRNWLMVVVMIMEIVAVVAIVIVMMMLMAKMAVSLYVMTTSGQEEAFCGTDR